MKIAKRREKIKTCAADQKKIPASTLESTNTRQKLKRVTGTYRQTQSSRSVGLEVFFILFTKERTNTLEVCRRLSFSSTLCLEVDLRIAAKKILWLKFYHLYLYFSVSPSTFWYGSGSGSVDPYLWLTDPDQAPDPALFDSDLQDATKKNVLAILFFWRYIYIILHR